MNGAPLTLAHGAPMRLIVPGWAGQHWVKWLVSARVQNEEAEGFYYQTGYRLPKSPVAPGTAVKPADTLPLTTLVVKSLIARPADGETLGPGRRDVVGIAFSGDAAIKRVEVSLHEGGDWKDARLEGPAGRGRWQLFRLPFEASAGDRLRIRSRATDTNGNVQPEVPAWNPSGYLWNGWHTVAATVTA
jgi:DMSO/TMAO reductase YedYZ molybdopterin-dependent catalytic subunit